MTFARFLTADEWREYLSGDGVYVIDCDLRQTLSASAGLPERENDKSISGAGAL